MTILNGEVYKCEGFDEVREQLEITPREIFAVLSEEERQEVIDLFNRYRDDYDSDRAETIDDLPEFVYEEWREWVFVDRHELLLRLLADREHDYVHLYDGVTHTIIKIHADPESVDDAEGRVEADPREL